MIWGSGVLRKQPGTCLKCTFQALHCAPMRLTSPTTPPFSGISWGREGLLLRHLSWRQRERTRRRLLQTDTSQSRAVFRLELAPSLQFLQFTLLSLVA